MAEIIKLSEVESSIIELHGERVILDFQVANLYDVETKRINEAVRNNPDKFPEGYIVGLELSEWKALRSKFSTLENRGKGQHTKYAPKAFTEKGLYMLATILKSHVATQTTIAIVETFTKLRELSQTISALTSIDSQEEKSKQKSLMERSGEILADLIDDGLQTTDTETTFEVNLAVLKLKHTVKRKK